jgi:hypothetical protein
MERRLPTPAADLPICASHFLVNAAITLAVARGAASAAGPVPNDGGRAPRNECNSGDRFQDI